MNFPNGGFVSGGFAYILFRGCKLTSRFMVFRFFAFVLASSCLLAGCQPRESSGRRTSQRPQSVVSVPPVAPPLFWKKRPTALALRCRQSGVRVNDLRLVVEKEPRWWQFEGKAALSQHPTLLVYAGRQLVKAYPAALGFDPIRDKEKRGDYRTPEGQFYLCGRNAQSQFFRSLRLNYPNAEDATRGFRRGLIDRATHNRIVRANRHGGVPPQNTDLGGDIMIHGGGIGSNWTWGCIALENSAVQELFDFLPLNTPVEIRATRR